MKNFEWSFLYIAAALNTFFLSLVLFKIRKGKRIANAILGMLLLIWAYGFFYTWMIETDLYRSFPHIILVGASNSFLMGPGIYFYVRALSFPGFSFRKKDAYHLLPFLLHTVYLLPFYLSGAADKLNFWEMDKSFSSIFYIFVYFQVLHLVIYLFCSLFVLRKHRQGIRENFSNIEKINLSWIRYIIFVSFAGLVFFGATMMFFVFSRYRGAYINRISDIFLMFLIFVTGYRGLVQVDIPGERGNSPQSPEKYLRSSLAKERVREITDSLQGYMEREEAFLDNDLTLKKLSEKTGFSIHHISQALNQGLQMNFFEFINRYRVEYAQALLNTQRDGNATILEIAYSSGFNSKSSFNSVFREYCGMTPTQYRKSLINEK